MFNLIVAVLSIALIGITAGASVYYGGTAFSNSNNRGQVSALISAGGQIAAAQSLHRTEQGGVAATSITGLTSTNYLQAEPSVPSGLPSAGQWTIVDAGKMAVLQIENSAAEGTSAEMVCKKVVEEGGAYITGDVVAENSTWVDDAALADMTVATTLDQAVGVTSEGFNDGRRVNFACLETANARVFGYRI